MATDLMEFTVAHKHVNNHGTSDGAGFQKGGEGKPTGRNSLNAAGRLVQLMGWGGSFWRSDK